MLSLFPDDFWAGLLGTTIYALYALILFPLFWKILNLITPGDLNAELVPISGKQPNVALAVVVGFIALGFCIILAAAIH